MILLSYLFHIIPFALTDAVHHFRERLPSRRGEETQRRIVGLVWVSFTLVAICS